MNSFSVCVIFNMLFVSDLNSIAYFYDCQNSSQPLQPNSFIMEGLVHRHRYCCFIITQFMAVLVNNTSRLSDFLIVDTSHLIYANKSFSIKSDKIT